MTTKRNAWHVFHKWAGLLFCLLMPVFCISGIILNHREAVAGLGVSRSLLPPGYRISSFNNGIVKGTLPQGADSLIVFGSNGIWLADRGLSSFRDFNAGLPEGADRRNIRNIVRTSDGRLWAAANYGLFTLGAKGWEQLELPGDASRVADVTLAPDSASVIALTRDGAFRADASSATPIPLKAPDGYKPQVTLFKTVWMLHSGELFGMTGRIIVDILAVILTFLCLTGLVLFILPYSIRSAARRAMRATVKRCGRWLKWNFTWHGRVGYWTLILMLVIAVTGMCLRPPLMIPLVLTRTAPLPGSALDSDNPWHDKLRAIRFDEQSDRWILSTSEGFFTVDRDFSAAPAAVAKDAQPAVSPMGVNVFEKDADGNWLIGSFSGMFRWNTADGTVSDYFTGKPVDLSRRGRPLSSALVAGYSAHTAKPAVFDYSEGNPSFGTTPEILASQPLSLWNTALELHVGRCYTPIIGPFSELFVFFSGLVLALVLISGLIIYNRKSKKKIKESLTETQHTK